METSRYDKIITKLNGLLLMNALVEKTFTQVESTFTHYNLASFFKEKAIERNQFNQLLQQELKKLETKFGALLRLQNRVNHHRMLQLKKEFSIDTNLQLFKQVYIILKLSVKKYNDLLMEMHLPLSLCKLLVKQRDRIQASLNTILEEPFVVQIT